LDDRERSLRCLAGADVVVLASGSTIYGEQCRPFGDGLILIRW
jgi:hypothetical protein